MTVFAGDETVPPDLEAEQSWRAQGLKQEQIYRYGREENWWGPAGQTGPCGPDTEIFYDMGRPKCGPGCGPSCQCGKYVEIWNNVFMKYNKTAEGEFVELAQKNVDTGMGLERVLTIFNGKTNVYDTELFLPVMTQLNSYLEKAGGQMPFRDRRIVCEHIRAISFILGDPRRITPSNTEQGYILRRLIRRVIRLLKQAELSSGHLCELAEIIIRQYGEAYPELSVNCVFILVQLQKEYALFSKTLDEGLKRRADIWRMWRKAGCWHLSCMIPTVFPLNLRWNLPERGTAWWIRRDFIPVFGSISGLTSPLGERSRGRIWRRWRQL